MTTPQAINFQLTEKEFVFSFLYLKLKPTFLNCIFSSIILIVYFRAVYEMSLFVNIALAISLIFFVVAPLGLIILAYRAKKEYKSNYSFRNEVNIEFNDSGYIVTTNDGNHNHREWAYLYSVREVKHGFFLYYSIHTATYIPKRCFNSEDSITFFKELVLNHLDSDKVYFKTAV